MMNVNCLSHIAVIKAALPGMQKRKSGQIINILSCSGIAGLPCRTMYSASKFGLSGFGKALRAEVKPHGIHICQIYPGYVQTNISKNAMVGDGSTFGKMDSNIKTGMPVDKAVKQIMVAATLKRTEFILGKLMYQFTPYLALNEWFINKYSDKKFKSQVDVKNKAE